MSVLILCEYATTSGGERSMLAALDAGVAQTAGVSVAVAAPPAGPLSEALRARGIELVPFETHSPAGIRVTQDELRRRLGELLASRRPRLLDANSLAMGRLAGPVAAELKIPSIGHLRDIIKISRQAVADLNCHTRLLAVSRAAREFHVAAGVTREKTHVLYNGVDLAEFQPRRPSDYLHCELGIAPHVKLVGAIGQIGIRKGLDVLAQAAVLLKDSLPDVHYVLVGQRWSEKDEALRFEADLHDIAGGELAGRVHFLGYRDDVPRLLNELTILVHPARQEPLGRVLLEAAAVGVAVVATDVGGTREIFPPDAGAARLVPPDDAGALAATMSELLGDEPLRLRLGEAARRRMETAFDAAIAAYNLAEHYCQVVNR